MPPFGSSYFKHDSVGCWTSFQAPESAGSDPRPDSAVCPWENYRTSLGLSFLTHNVEFRYR